MVSAPVCGDDNRGVIENLILARSEVDLHERKFAFHHGLRVVVVDRREGVGLERRAVRRLAIFDFILGHTM